MTYEPSQGWTAAQGAGRRIAAMRTGERHGLWLVLALSPMVLVGGGLFLMTYWGTWRTWSLAEIFGFLVFSLIVVAVLFVITEFLKAVFRAVRWALAAAGSWWTEKRPKWVLAASINGTVLVAAYLFTGSLMGVFKVWAYGMVLIVALAVLHALWRALSNIGRPRLSRRGWIAAILLAGVLLWWFSPTRKHSSARFHSVRPGLVLDTDTGLYCSPYPWKDTRGYPPCQAQ